MTLNTILFGIYPYIALVICVGGCMIRFDLAPYSWRADSSQLLRSKGMRLASNMFHVGILMVIGGHVMGLLTPPSIYHYVISTENKQMMSMVFGGAFGVVCLLGMITLLERRLMDPRVKANSRFSDTLVLVLLLAQLLLGLVSIFISMDHLDGSVMLLLCIWAQNIVILDPLTASAAIVGVHWIYKAHILLGLSLFVIFPFTRLVHIISVPVWYLGRRYQIVRQKA